ncbi:hypothetical protein V1527DRAFT_499663 [Lipomyces starkeyi]
MRLYAAGIILHPSRRKHYIRQNWDSIYHQNAFDAVEILWKIEYKDKATVDVSTISASNDSDAFDEFARDLDVTASTITKRVFSGARRTISWDRARLGAANIEHTECLKSWLRSNITAGIGIIHEKTIEDGPSDIDTYTSL